jgi:hypothetical protein
LRADSGADAEPTRRSTIQRIHYRGDVGYERHVGDEWDEWNFERHGHYGHRFYLWRQFDRNDSGVRHWRKWNRRARDRHRIHNIGDVGWDHRLWYGIHWDVLWDFLR